MEYYQTETYWMSTGEWVSVSNIIPMGNGDYDIIESERLTGDQTDAELKRLRATYKNLDFRVMPYND